MKYSGVPCYRTWLANAVFGPFSNSRPSTVPSLSTFLNENGSSLISSYAFSMPLRAIVLSARLVNANGVTLAALGSSLHKVSVCSPASQSHMITKCVFVFILPSSRPYASSWLALLCSTSSSKTCTSRGKFNCTHLLM